MRVRVHFECLRHEVRIHDEDFLELCCVELEVEKVPLPETFKKSLQARFHVRLGAGLSDVVKGRGGCAKISSRTRLEGGSARSRRDPAIPMVEDSAPALSEQIRAKPLRKSWDPGSTCDWGRGRGTL